MSQNRFHANNQQTLIEKAEKLSKKLFANEVSSVKLHEKILKLDELYMHILSNDRKKLLEEFNDAKRANQKKSTLPLYKIIIDRQPLLDIIKNILTYKPVEDEDNDMASKIDLPESKHVQDYIKFLKACGDYANYIKKLLLRMRSDLGEQVILKLNSITVDMDLNDVLDLYEHVMDVFENNSLPCYEKYSKLLSSIKFINSVSPATMLFKSHLAVTGELYKSGHKVLSKSNLKMKY